MLPPAPRKGERISTPGVVILLTHAARLLAVDVLLAGPGALANDALEGDLYILRDQLRGADTPDTASPRVPLGR